MLTESAIEDAESIFRGIAVSATKALTWHFLQENAVFRQSQNK